MATRKSVSKEIPNNDSSRGSGNLTVPAASESLTGPNIVCLEQPTGWVRRPAEFIVDLSGRAIEHHLHVEEANQRHGSYRNEFADVLVFGQHFFHGFLSRDLRIDCQSIEGVRRLLETHLAHHPGRRAQIPQIYRKELGYRVDCCKVEPEVLEGTLYFGTPIEPCNWGMWLLQAIPSAIDFLTCAKAERFLVNMSEDWQRRLLNTLGISNNKLVHQALGQTYECRNLVLKQYSEIDLVPTPMEIDLFDGLAREVAGVAKGRANRRLFVSRQWTTRETNGLYRALLNEDELVEALSSRGYEIVEPELLPFADQIRLFSEARLVVGLGGAGMFNVIFSPPGTKVVSIESSNKFVHSHAGLFSALGHSYGVIFGKEDMDDKEPVQKRWTIDVRAVMEVLDQLD